MSAISRRRTAAATAVVVVLSVVQFVLFTVEAAPAAAHHPEVVAASVCEDDVAHIEYEVTAWATQDLDRRHNNDVRLTIGDELVASGAFNAGNDFSFGGSFDASAYIGQTVTLRATAVARWGVAEDKGSANEYRETSVTVTGECGGSTTTLPPYEPPSCPIPDETAIAFELDHDGRVRAAGSVDDATSGPYPIDLPAGVYDVYLTSRDRNHSESFDPSQTQESYFVRGFFEGANVWESPAISDLGDDQVNLTELVASGVSIPTLDAVSAIHAAHPDDESNSIVPVCVVFVPEPQPEPQPVDVVVSGTCVLVEKQAFARTSVDSIDPDGDVIVTIGGVPVPEGGFADLALDTDLAVVVSSPSEASSRRSTSRP